MHRIRIISAGPGGRGYITGIALQKARQCDVIIGTEQQVAAAGHEPGQTVHKENSVEGIMRLIEQHEGELVGVLVTGDAGIYSLAQRIIARFGKEAVEEVIPGVSSIQAAFARVKEPWLNVRVFSFHGRPLEGLGEILHCDRAAILCDREHDAKAVLSALARLGLFTGQLDVYVCRNLTMEDEEVIEVRGPGDIEGIGTGRREIVLLIKTSNSESRLQR